MKYAFVELLNPENGESLYMEPREFERYKDKRIFRETAQAIVIIDRIYIGCFELLNRIEDIKRHNDEAQIVIEKMIIPGMINNNFCDMAKRLGADNYHGYK